MLIHRRIVSFALLTAALLLVGGTAWAEDKKKSGPRRPMLWVVDMEPKLYLFGTMHVGDPKVLAHPPVVKHALKESGALYTEIDFNEQTTQEMAKRVRLPDGQSLDKIVPAELYARTEKLMEGKGPPLKMFNRAKVWFVIFRLQMLDADPKTQGNALDLVLAKDAKEAGKNVGALETVTEQVDIFDNLSTDEQVRMLEETVARLEKARKEGVSPLESLKQVYLSGDEHALWKAMYSEFDPNDELSVRLMKQLLDDRNVRMVKRMLQRALAAPEHPHFVAVGAGHMPGEMGIVSLLRKTGFTVRRLNSMADVEKPKAKRKRVAATTPAAATTPSSRARPAAARPRIVIRRFGPFCWRECCCPPAPVCP